MREARLIDDRRFEEWLDLFTDDAVYWMPGRRSNVWRSGAVEDSVTKPGELALFEDTKQTLTTRVARLRTGMAWGEEPPSRTRHLITNIEVETRRGSHPATRPFEFSGVPRAGSNTRRDIFAGMREDVLRRIGGDLKIAKRTLRLEDVVHDTKALSIFF